MRECDKLCRTRYDYCNRKQELPIVQPSVHSPYVVLSSCVMKSWRDIWDRNWGTEALLYESLWDVVYIGEEKGEEREEREGGWRNCYTCYPSCRLRGNIRLLSTWKADQTINGQKARRIGTQIDGAALPLSQIARSWEVGGDTSWGGKS